VRKLIFLVLIGAVAYFAYTRYLANPALSGSLQFPSRIAWRGTSHNPAEAGKPAYDMVEVVAVDNNKWRTEAITISTDRRRFVAVFDGQHFVCSSPTATAEQVDPTTGIRLLFKALPYAKYEGSESLNGRPAWRFSGATFGGGTGTTWIDQETRFVARVTATMPDGKTLDESYRVLPSDIEGNASRLFDTRSATSIFTNYLHYR